MTPSDDGKILAQNDDYDERFDYDPYEGLSTDELMAKLEEEKKAYENAQKLLEWPNISRNRQPFNLDWLECPPLRWMVEESTRMNGTGYDLGAIFALGVLSAVATGKKFIRRNKTHVEPLHDWFMAITPSGVGKSPVMGIFKKHLLEWECEANKSIRKLEAMHKAKEKALKANQTKAEESGDVEAAAKWAAELEDLEPVKQERVIYNGGDITAAAVVKYIYENDDALALFDDEASILSVLCGKYSTGDGDSGNDKIFLGGHSGSGYEKTTMKNGTYRSTKSAISICLATQEDKYTDYMKQLNQTAATGLLARFLIAFPEPPKKIPRFDDDDAGISPETEWLYDMWLNELLARRDGKDITFSPESLQAATDFERENYNHLEDEIGHEAKGKARSHFMRLCGLLAFSCFRDVVSVSDVKNAGYILKWFWGHMNGGALSERQKVVVEYLAKNVRDNSTMTARQIAGKIINSGHKGSAQKQKRQDLFSDPRKIKSAQDGVIFTMVELEEIGYLNLNPVFGSNGTPDSCTVEVNPRLYTGKADTVSIVPRETLLAPVPKRDYDPFDPLPGLFPDYKRK